MGFFPELVVFLVQVRYVPAQAVGDQVGGRKLNEKKKANLDKRLKAGLISQEQYDKQVEKLNKQQEAREKEAKGRLWS